MTAELSRAARVDLRAYAYQIVATSGAGAAARELARVRTQLEAFAASPADGVVCEIGEWPETLRRHYIHPFRVYYVRRTDGIFVVRLWHHARRPIEC
jgi:plasmid stabilization system protein ParE